MLFVCVVPFCFLELLVFSLRLFLSLSVFHPMQKSCQIALKLKLVWVAIVSIVSIVSNENMIRPLALLLSNML